MPPHGVKGRRPLMTKSSNKDCVTLKLQHFLLATAPVHFRVLLPWVEKIAKESGGRIKIEVYPAMELGGTPASLYDQARDGVVDLVWAMPSYNPGRFPLIEVFELPFMMTARTATSCATYEYARAYCNEEFRDVHMLSMFVIGPGGFFMRDKPVRTSADLKGLRLRAPTPRTAKLAAALGAKPVETPPSTVRANLIGGVFDGAMINWDFAGGTGTYEVAKYNSETDESFAGLYTSVIGLAMNRDSYNRMPEDLKAILDANSGESLARWIGSVMNGAEEGWREKARAIGNHINIIPVAELERWRKPVQPVIDDWVNDVTRLGHDGKRMLQAARDLIIRYSTA